MKNKTKKLIAILGVTALLLGGLIVPCGNGDPNKPPIGFIHKIIK